MTDGGDPPDAAAGRDRWTVRHEVDDATEPAVAVVAAVAAATGSDPTAMSPLGDVVDTDALNAMLGPDGDSVRVSFSFHGVDVHAGRDGEIRVRPGSPAGE